MSLFTESVPLSVHNSIVATLTATLERTLAQLADVTKEALAIKRHDVQMPPQGFDVSSLDPMNALGPKTQAAIDEDCDGDPGDRNYLIGRAHVLYASERAHTSDLDELDARVAALILRGDRA